MRWICAHMDNQVNQNNTFNLNEPAISTRERLHQEIEATQQASHSLIVALHDDAFSQPSNNPAGTIGQVLYHNHG